MSLHAMATSVTRPTRSRRAAPQAAARLQFVGGPGFLPGAPPAPPGAAVPPVPANPASQSSTTTGALDAAGAANVVNLVRQLTALLPTEILAVYIVIVSLVPTVDAWKAPAACSFLGPIAPGSPDFWLWLTTIVCAVLCPLIVLFLAMADNRQKTAPGAASASPAPPPFFPPAWGMAASLIGFVAWSTYIPNSILAHCYWASATYVGTLIVVLTTAVIYGINLFMRAKGWPSIDIQDVTVVLPQSPGQQGTLGTAPITAGRVSGGPGLPPVPLSLFGNSQVIAAPQIYSLFLDDSWNTQLSVEYAACNDFLGKFIKSTLYTRLAIYGVGTAAIAGAWVVSGWQWNPTTDAEIKTAIDDAISGHGITVTDDTVFVVYTPKGVTVDPQGAVEVKAGEVLCGYHSYSAQCAYAVIIYPDSARALGGKTTENALATEISHEVAEMLTNPLVKSGGWRTNELTGSREIGDLCQNLDAPIGTYSAQQLYINGIGCVGR